MSLPGTDKAIANLTEWGMRDDWRDAFDDVVARHLGPVCDALGIERQDLADRLGPMPFMIFMGCVYEDFFTTVFDPDGSNVIDDYLKRRGWRETVSGRRYLAALRRSVMSVHEVVDIVPGQLTLKDLCRGGEPVTVEEKAGSKSAAPWDRLAGRVLEINGKHYLAGGLLHLPADVADRVLAGVREAIREHGKSFPGTEAERRDRVLAEMVPLFTSAWLAAWLERTAQPLPELRNMDGHAIAFTTVRFPIAEGGADEVATRIDHLNVFGRDGGETEPAWTWYDWLDADGNVVVLPLGDAVPEEYRRAGRNRILGRLHIKGDTLLVEVNSVERAHRAQTLLNELLGTFIGHPLMTVQSPEQAMAERPSAPPPEDTADEIPREVKTQIIHQFLDEHYGKTLDQPIPMLGNKSPRACVRTPKGRAKVVAWLKGVDNNESRRSRMDGTEPYDTTWMWRELGLLDLRK